MGKNTRGHKERSREQELKFENAKLRRQVASLRKQIARLDLDRYSHLRDMIDEQLRTDEVQDGNRIIDDLKKTWTCFDCGSGHLEIITYSKMGEPWYYRQCTNCSKRTKSQAYNENVKGIKKETEEE